MWLLTKEYREKLVRVGTSINEHFHSIMNSKTKMKLLIIFYLILVVSLKLVLSEYRPGHSDPGGDSSLVLDGAMSIREGRGYTYDSIWLFDQSDGGLG